MSWNSHPGYAVFDTIRPLQVLCVWLHHNTFRLTLKEADSKHQRVRLDKDWIVPTRWSWITETPLVGQAPSWVCMLNLAIWNEVCRSNGGSVIQWERVGKYQPYPVRTFIVWQRLCEPARLRIAYCLSIRDCVSCLPSHIYRHVPSELSLNGYRSQWPKTTLNFKSLTTKKNENQKCGQN